MEFEYLLHFITRELKICLEHWSSHETLIEDFDEKINNNLLDYIYDKNNFEIDDLEYVEYINDNFSDNEPIKSVCCFGKI